MLIWGLAVLSFGFAQLVPPLSLLFCGSWAEARSTIVVKEADDGSYIVSKTNADLKNMQKDTDRRSRFWNIFEFKTKSTPQEARLPFASSGSPLYPLTTPRGDPVTLPIVYLPDNPSRFIFPTVFGTWVFQGVITVIGLITTFVAIQLLATARKPIELPAVHNHAK